MLLNNLKTEMYYEINPASKISLGLKELWQYRELFYFFTWRDIKVKYKQTVLGFAWAILQPLFMTLIFTIFLGDIISSKVEISLPYPVFVLSGMLLWGIFSSGLSNAANSMVNNANIIKKIYFPRLIIPMSSILVALFDFLMAFIVFIPFIIFYDTFLYIHSIFLIPLSIIITVLASFGLGTFLSALNIKYRDFRYIVPFFIQALLFLTPVIYPGNITSNIFIKWIIRLNPMTSAIEVFRASFNSSYSFTIDFWISLCVALFLFFAGLFYFRKTEHYFADLA
jgi:lipopolysaccharide transport system permease protein